MTTSQLMRVEAVVEAFSCMFHLCGALDISALSAVVVTCLVVDPVEELHFSIAKVISKRLTVTITVSKR